MPKQKNEELFKYLGLRIKDKRRELKLSKEKLAEYINVNDTQIYKYESGISKIPIDKLILLSKLFKVNIKYFIGEYNFKEPKNNQLEKRIIELREIYNINDENLISIVNNSIDSIYESAKNKNNSR